MVMQFIGTKLYSISDLANLGLYIFVIKRVTCLFTGRSLKYCTQYYGRGVILFKKICRRCLYLKDFLYLCNR